MLNQDARAYLHISWTSYTPFGIGDYNVDGHPDIIARNDAAAYLALMPGNGGQLTSQTTISTGTRPGRSRCRPCRVWT